jgi:phosphohistidine phosphatase
MLLYLIRHAHAVKEEDDPLRPLSPRGRDEVRRLAVFLQANRALAPSQIWHSPLLRARETAEGLAAALGLEGTLVETGDLLPEDEPEVAARRIHAFPTGRSLALVGHEPHLSGLATLLLRGKPQPPAVEFRKGAILALGPTGDHHRRSGEPRWDVKWMLTPALLPAQAALPQQP